MSQLSPDAAAAALEQQFCVSSCHQAGSNSNTEDAKLLEALYHTQPRGRPCSHCRSNLTAAYATVGLAYLPFAILEDPDRGLGGIPEELILVVDYDSSQLHTCRAIVEMVRSIDTNPSNAVWADGRIVDWMLPCAEQLRQLDDRVHLTQLRCGSCASQHTVQLHLDDGVGLFVVDRAHAATLGQSLEGLVQPDLFPQHDGSGAEQESLGAECSTQSARRGVWENRLFDDLDRDGVVHIQKLSQFLDFFTYSYGRTVASMFDTSFEFVEECMERIIELQALMAEKSFAFLHLNLIADAAEMVAAIEQNQILVTRMNISNVMDYVDGEEEYNKISRLTSLQRHCDLCMPIVFVDAYIGGGIKTSLAFEGEEWPQYLEAVNVYDQLLRTQENGSVDNQLKQKYQKLLTILRNNCTDKISPTYVFD